MESVMIEIDGLPVPFFVEDFEEKTSDTLILSLEDLGSEESVKELIGCRVFISKNHIRFTDHRVSIHQLSLVTGYTVIDKNSGKLGHLEEIINIELNPLLRILGKSKEILLPFQPEFVTGIDPVKKIVYVSAPSGLIDLY
jgi:16S rRNA processing protein RimM